MIEIAKGVKSNLVNGSYIHLALEAFLPPCIHNGVAFEAHGQNTLARFDIKTKKLLGFVIRDFGGIKVHQETLRQSCGAEIDVLPDSCVVAEDPSEVRGQINKRSDPPELLNF